MNNKPKFKILERVEYAFHNPEKPISNPIVQYNCSGVYTVPLNDSAVAVVEQINSTKVKGFNPDENEFYEYTKHEYKLFGVYKLIKEECLKKYNAKNSSSIKQQQP